MFLSKEYPHFPDLINMEDRQVVTGYLEEMEKWQVQLWLGYYSLENVL